jgi:O-acetyl-ADP-ribose deacetylase (regulator of RNase III)
MLGGGAVDGAISHAGGPALLEARKAVPEVPNPMHHPLQDSAGMLSKLKGWTGKTAGSKLCRCPTGEARITIGGDLQAKYVVHAVGPNYAVLTGLGWSESDCDALLASAYENSMKAAQTKGDEIKSIAFSLISAGVFRGSKTVNSVLDIGVRRAIENIWEGLDEMHFVAYTDSEAGSLQDILDVLVEEGVLRKIE